MRSLATANPEFYATQAEAYEFMRGHFPMAMPAAEMYRRLLLEGPIRGRYFGLERREQAGENSPDQCLARFQKHGRAVAGKAARAALAAAGIQAEHLGGVVVNTCTGYLCPGLSSYLAEDLGLPVGVRAVDLMGMGCAAALPNLETAAGLLRNGLDGPVLSVAVEICSATVIVDSDPGVIVSNCIFGDGAAAAVLDRDGPGLLRIREFGSVLLPQHREQLRYRTVDGRLRNVLGRRVPILAAHGAQRVLQGLLERRGLRQADLGWWAVHPGGTSVLDKVGERLGLNGELRFSREVFAEYGNMSSPTVLFVLRRILDAAGPVRGERGVLLTFGAGFSVCGALVEFL